MRIPRSASKTLSPCPKAEINVGHVDARKLWLINVGYRASGSVRIVRSTETGRRKPIEEVALICDGIVTLPVERLNGFDNPPPTCTLPMNEATPSKLAAQSAVGTPRNIACYVRAGGYVRHRQIPICAVTKIIAGAETRLDAVEVRD